ncbi:pimeloyl-ACP methyl ester carboxylesterase [Kribbella amoyensis]|uniref:Pimeloyl-ACP methyl ester carboxylesterase n=1 Tax=Kribbella amoyensis TaxID=996641 RepID=A0A561B0Y3_9ACTN|nr:alpha/beta fold hydrolase [Kribbella amoyensis]TWD72523.1 pimeloyl-ACP methyl ester carboxylesterase [Kribbella amoyensis]
MTTAFPEVHPATKNDADDDLPVVLLHGGNVANWMWEPQLDALSHRTVVTPDLPGFGRRTEEPWPGLGGGADDVVTRVEHLTGSPRFHVVGLSLGGAVALHLAARHPGSAASVLVSGAPVLPVKGFSRALARLQLTFWDSPWFWKALAAGFRLPADSRDLYVRHGLSVHRETARRMLDDVHAGGIPPGLTKYPGPLLLVAGEREPRVVHRSLQALAAAVPHAQTRLVPKMHHIWNVEDPQRFDATLATWLAGEVSPDLSPL